MGKRRLNVKSKIKMTTISRDDRLDFQSNLPAENQKKKKNSTHKN